MRKAIADKACFLRLKCDFLLAVRFHRIRYIYQPKNKNINLIICFLIVVFTLTEQAVYKNIKIIIIKLWCLLLPRSLFHGIDVSNTAGVYSVSGTMHFIATSNSSK